MPSKLAGHPFDAGRIDIPIIDLIAQVAALPLEALRSRWRLCHPGLKLPDKLSRDLLVRGIAWQEQCCRYGGLPSDTRRVLDKMATQLEVSGTLEVERSVRPKTGTRILREWRGQTYVVEVTDDGFMHDDKIFASLSHVARAITGTRWSGPRFFGLNLTDPMSREGHG